MRFSWPAGPFGSQLVSSPPTGGAFMPWCETSTGCS
jgi:hypothetical protein